MEVSAYHFFEIIQTRKPKGTVDTSTSEAFLEVEVRGFGN